MKKNSFLEQIRKETPEEVKVFVRHHAEIVIRVNELLAKKGCMDNQPYYKKYISDVVNYFWKMASQRN